MSWKEQIQRNRFKTVGKFQHEYKFDRWIFQTAMFLIFAFLFYIAWSNNFEMNYFKCERMHMSDGSFLNEKIIDAENFGNEALTCKNPFYKPITWQNYERLLPGEYGFKPNFLFKSAIYVSFGLLALAFILNHLIYNKKFRLDLKGGDQW